MSESDKKILADLRDVLDKVKDIEVLMNAPPATSGPISAGIGLIAKLMNENIYVVKFNYYGPSITPLKYYNGDKKNLKISPEGLYYVIDDEITDSTLQFTVSNTEEADRYIRDAWTLGTVTNSYAYLCGGVVAAAPLPNKDDILNLIELEQAKYLQKYGMHLQPLLNDPLTNLMNDEPVMKLEVHYWGKGIYEIDGIKYFIHENSEQSYHRSIICCSGNQLLNRILDISKLVKILGFQQIKSPVRDGEPRYKIHDKGAVYKKSFCVSYYGCKIRAYPIDYQNSLEVIFGVAGADYKFYFRDLNRELGFFMAIFNDIPASCVDNLIKKLKVDVIVLNIADLDIEI